MTVQPHAAAFELSQPWRELLDLGFSVFPVELRGKRPLGPWKAFQTERASLDTVRQWASRPSNIGIATGAISGLLVLDLDSADAIAEAERRGLPDTLAVRTAKGRHVYFQHPGGTIGNRAGLLPGWDIRGDGGYVVAPGSVHESGATYAWEHPPGMFDLAPAPAWLLAMLAKPEGEPDNVRPFPTDRTAPWAEAALRNELAVLMGAAEGRRNQALNDAALKLGQIVAGGHLDQGEVKRRLHATAGAIGLDPDEIGPTIESGFSKGMTEPRDPPERESARRGTHDPETGEIGAEKKRTKSKDEPSEDDIALAFTARHGETLRFDHDAGRWYEWDGARWRPDTCHRAFSYAREIGRQHGAAGRANFAGGVERFARTDKQHAVNADAWDMDPWLLGTPGGTVDLRTGALAPARPADMITKLAGVAPERGEPVLWLRFLNEALAGDKDAIRFLQLWAGYALTGDTREHALIFLHGLAGTGKSVFVNTLAAILGDYAVTATMDTFVSSKFERHSTELAMLKGARLVTASETEEGRTWAEARIKTLTGGDTVTARFMRQDNFMFRPQFKLTLVGNHAPRLANPDDAMRRRFNILGFNVKPAVPDLQLEEKLKAEHGRILAWAIAGCLDWQASGLVRPAAVQDATTEYFAGEDLLGQWLADRCTLRAGAFELPAKLYNDWRKYADEHGEAPGTAIGFGKRMAKRGLGAKVSNGIRANRGVELRPQPGDYDAA